MDDAQAELTNREAPPLVRAAGPDDVPLLLQLFWELAEYEHLEDAMRATDEGLRAALFGERPAAQALIAERGSQVAGYAVFFPTFSSFLTAPGVWLEDLFVRPPHRGVGGAGGGMGGHPTAPARAGFGRALRRRAPAAEGHAGG